MLPNRIVIEHLAATLAHVEDCFNGLETMITRQWLNNGTAEP